MVAVLAEEVIRRVSAQARAARDAAAVTPARIEALSRALLGQTEGVAEALVREARLSGAGAEALYHGLVAGAVLRVGEAWARDEVGLGEVVRASARVWRIMRELRDIFVRVTDRKPGHQAVFCLCPGEVHTIGLTMTADDLRRRGWDIELVLGLDDDAMVARLDALAPSTVALAATMAELSLPLARAVVALRAHLPGVWIMVGGQITADVPEILALTGADAVANSADEAERLMLDHLADLAARRVNHP
jgi:methanogenic corrinoid protein MtbC1